VISLLSDTATLEKLGDINSNSEDVGLKEIFQKAATINPAISTVSYVANILLYGYEDYPSITDR
jgi:hypothetical protein